MNTAHTVTYRPESSKPDWTDWKLACALQEIFRQSRYHDDPLAEVIRQVSDQFTADEVARAQRVLATGKPDTERLAAIESRLADTDNDTKWLVEQVKQTWAWLEALRDAIDNSGALMHNTYAASCVEYVRWSREL
jgi:hypothetical protein